MKKNVILLLILLVFSSFTKVEITSEQGMKSPTVKKSAREFKELVEEAMMLTPDKMIPYCFNIKQYENIKDGSFGYRIDKAKANRIELYAGDEMGLTHAMYTLLEDIGYTFDITGISKPERIEWSVLENADRLVTPKVRWRGIRQHVNFPMDISSYSMEDAKKYIDCLVRLRMNKLAIHSYPGQWYETHIGDSLALAGNYFYGNKHYMYNNPLLIKHIPDNDSLFCIPKAEKFRKKPNKQSSFAIKWMQELIRYSKERGLYVQFSFEPRVSSVEQAVSTARDIIRTYPEIDALELITEETGGWGKSCTKEETLSTLKTYFSLEIAKDTTVLSPILKKQSDLNTLYTQVGINCKAIEKLESENTFGAVLKLGIYCSINKYAKAAYHLARLALPKTSICLMPAHGSDATAKAIPQVVSSADDLKYTELYSWIEFDGLMFLQQNSIDGNKQVMDEMDRIKSEQHTSILYNHWRTAENRTSARYVAISTLTGSLSAEDFYIDYAFRIGIQSKERYAQAMKLINQADVYARYQLPNIGFCWMGAWRKGGPYVWMKASTIKHTRSLYFESVQILTELLMGESSNNAHNYLSFLRNRTYATVIYLDAFVEAVKIQQIIKGKEESLSSEEKKSVQAICNRTLAIFNQYMEVHARMLVDRGCEGTLVSAWNAPIQGLKNYCSKLTGIPIDELSDSEEAVDAPPLPILYE